MSSTRVKFPEHLLEDLDRLASEVGVSRDRLIVKACQDALRRHRGWPKDFFDNSRFSPEDLKELQESAESFEEELIASRRSRSTTPL